MNTYKLEPSTLMDRLRAHLLEDYEISEADHKTLARWQAAHALMLDEAESDRNIVRFLVKNFSISDRCAYNDIRSAKMLFGDVRASTKEGLRYLVTQWSIELFRMARQTKNLKAMEKALERITKANNLDKEDPDLPDASRIQPPVQLLSVNFSFINSPRFKLIDESAQAAILRLYDEFMTQVRLTELGEYTDLFQLSVPESKEP